MSPEKFNMDPIALKAFCVKWKVERLCVFGSVLRGEARPDSDLDVLVDYSAGAAWTLFDHQVMEDELTVLAGRKVDLVSRKGLLRSANVLRKEGILSSAEEVYAA